MRVTTPTQPKRPYYAPPPAKPKPAPKSDAVPSLVIALWDAVKAPKKRKQ